nr:MAG TPA: hypothetical protein [Caudoviricetes sp.]DAU90481.1 MAG TPA: hypothetical protein [Caudoviricetes sp.]
MLKIGGWNRRQQENLRPLKQPFFEGMCAD